jgi:hypothetical protein
MILMKKIGILVGAFSFLVAVPVSIARNEKGNFFAQAASVPGTYSLTINNTVEFDTDAKTASINKQVGSTTLEILNTATLSFSNTNKLPITFAGDPDLPTPRIRLVQVQNIRSVSAVFSTTTSTVSFQYRYRDIVNNVTGPGNSVSATQNAVESNTEYFTPLRTDAGVGNNSYPDELLIIFSSTDASTFNSLTITYDC